MKPLSLLSAALLILGGAATVSAADAITDPANADAPVAQQHAAPVQHHSTAAHQKTAQHHNSKTSAQHTAHQHASNHKTATHVKPTAKAKHAAHQPAPAAEPTSTP